MNITHRSDLELEQAAKIKFLELQVLIAMNALNKIADLDYYEDGDGESNEWAEAVCFHKAQSIANKTLKETNMRNSFENWSVAA